MKRVAFATSSEFPTLWKDDLLALEPLRALGVQVVPRVWDAPSEEGDFDAVILRSCWDYHLKREAFQEWLGKQSVPCWNSPNIARWNLDKRYLIELQRRGAPVPETIYLERGTQVHLGTLLRERDLDDVVLKPAVSLSAYRTYRARRATAEQLQPAWEQALKDSAMLVQPFIAQVQSGGEASLVFIDGGYSHAVVKRPAPGDFRTQADFGATHLPLEPSAALRGAASDIVGLVAEPLLYARVDLVETPSGPLLMELELIDPVLFLATNAEAPARFAQAIARRL